MRFSISLFLLFISLCVTAQKAELLPQENLSKWGIAPANYSGITHVEGDTYAVVDDKSQKDGFYLFNIKINNKNGKIKSVSRSELRGPAHPESKAAYADCEGVAYVPSASTLFITHESSGLVKEYKLNGEPTGAQLKIPEFLNRSHQSRNGGFESLTYNAKTQTFWLTTENPLTTDKTITMPDGKERQPLRLVSFNRNLVASGQWAYLMDAPELKTNVKYYTHGVPALTALPDGRVLVMERELSIPSSYFDSKCTIKIYCVTPWANQPVGVNANAANPSAPGVVTQGTDLHLLPADKFLPKQLVATFSTNIGFQGLNYANFEGFCLGPTLNDGRQTLLLINDSQAGAGNSLYTLKDYIKVIILPKNFFP